MPPRRKITLLAALLLTAFATLAATITPPANAAAISKTASGDFSAPAHLASEIFACNSRQALGKTRIATTEGVCAFSYGKEADQLSRLNYYGYRYYDPLSLTWTQADPLFRFVPDIAYDQPRLMSLYAFSLNNPVRYVDPDGREPALVLTEGVKITPKQQAALAQGVQFMNFVATGRHEEVSIVHNHSSNAFRGVDFNGKDIAVVVVKSSGKRKGVERRVRSVLRSGKVGKRRARKEAKTALRKVRTPNGTKTKVGIALRSSGIAIVGTSAVNSGDQGTGAAAHEAGHSLGLPHDEREGNVMNESVETGDTGNQQIEEDQQEIMQRTVRQRRSGQ